MTKDYSSSASWNSAAIAGLLLAVLTIAIEWVGGLCGKVSGVAGGILNFLAWAAKLVLCAWTFRYLLKRFHSSYSGVDNHALKHYGLRLTLFSSLIVAAFSLVNMLVVNPDSVGEIIQTYRDTYSSMLDSNSEAALEKLLPKLPVYTGLVTLGYCYLWGWFYSGLFSKEIAPVDPFADLRDTPPDNQ